MWASIRKTLGGALTRRPRAFDWLAFVSLVAMGVLARLPCAALIPTFDDEVMETVYALSIEPGKFMPLVGNEPYVGPFFSYLVAVCLRVFGSSPAAPRTMLAVLNAMTAGGVYLLARTLRLTWPWAALAGWLMALNPHHILASHYAGRTYMVALFGVFFFVALALAVRRSSGWWLALAGVLLGLALQSNPVAALVLPGAAIWFVRRQPACLSWRTRWPYLAGVALALIYAPVILYNLQNAWLGVAVVTGRQTYAWQPPSSWLGYAHNLWRLALQLARQVGGVLQDTEAVASLLGLPLVLGLWGAGGLVCAARRGGSLLAWAAVSQVLIMPAVSNYYGDAYVARFTGLLTPLIAAAMALLAQGVWERMAQPAGRWALAALWIVCAVWPAVTLSQYYAQATAEGKTNARQLAFVAEFLQGWRGEPVLLSDSVNRPFFISQSAGEFNATEYLLATSRVPYRLMPGRRLVEYLATGQVAGRVTLVLSEEDVELIGPLAELLAADSPAMQVARQRGYGVYTLAEARQVRKPAFVLTDTRSLPASVRPAQVNLADQLGVLGYDLVTPRLTPGERFTVNVYWQALGPMSEGYVGFLHLIGADGQLVAQDDHELGRGVYRTLAWQPDEVIREKYEWVTPPDAPRGEYTLRLGAYRFPEIKRLPVRASSLPAQDDVITLDAVRSGP